MSRDNRKKRDRHVFQSVQELDEEDANALTKRRSSTQRQKQSSLAAISEQRIQTKLLEVRILLQRVLHHQDKDTNNDNARSNNENISDETNSEGKLSTKEESIRYCSDVLAKLLLARDTLLKYDGDDDDDDREETDHSFLVENEDALEQKLEDDFKACEQEWEAVLNRRHKEVRLHAGLTSKSQFRVLDSSFWEQVQQNVKHEKFLHSKSMYQKESDGRSSLFDDTRVYQHLLKDYLSSASSSGDATREQQLSSENRLRGSASERKRTVNHVDRRASKGRKIRYTPIPKLVNFTYPLSRPTGTHMLNEDSWFQSLFGGAAKSSGQQPSPHQVIVDEAAEDEEDIDSGS